MLFNSVTSHQVWHRRNFSVSQKQQVTGRYFEIPYFIPEDICTVHLEVARRHHKEEVNYLHHLCVI